MHTPLHRAAIGTLLLVVACGPRDDALPDASPPATTDPAPAETPAETDASTARPAMRQDTVMIEAMPQVEISRLFTSPANFALPFSTYVPGGLEAAMSGSSSVRFTAAFGGQRNPDAFLEMFVHPAGATRPVAAEIVNDLMATRGAAEHETFPVERQSWALSATSFRYTGADGTIMTGSVTVAPHEDRHFHLVQHYPVEYGDGLAPRLHIVLSEWRWENTGTMMMN